MQFPDAVETPPEVLSVTWYNNGHKIELSDKYRLSDEGGGRYMLEIQPVELGDDGEWKVVVKNEGGYASSLGKITLTGAWQFEFSSMLLRYELLTVRRSAANSHALCMTFDSKPFSAKKLQGTAVLGGPACTVDRGGPRLLRV